MDTYLSKRNRQDTSKKKKPKKKKNDEKDFNNEEKEYFEERGFFQRLVNFIAGEPEKKPKSAQEPEKEEIIEEAVEENKEFEEFEKDVPKKGGFNMIKKIKSWFASEEEEEGYAEVEEEIEEPVIPEDIKDVLKIQNRWLMRLPPKTIKEFKSSKDYEEYKVVLRKYGLIKKD